MSVAKAVAGDKSKTREEGGDAPRGSKRDGGGEGGGKKGEGGGKKKGGGGAPKAAGPQA